MTNMSSDIPARNSHPDPVVLNAVRRMSDEALRQGAVAAILFGSHARGASYEESDVDLTFIGQDRDSYLERRDGYLFSIDWKSADKCREAMNNPAWAGGAVQGLRSAFIVADPRGLAGRLKEEAAAWTWDAIADKCDAWVAEQITSLAEDVQRAFGHYRLGKRWIATVFKGMLSARLGMILAVHLRTFYESENRVWDLVCDRVGEPWKSAQSAAFSSRDESYRESFEATMKLYAIAVGRVWHLMNQRQRDVTRGTCEATGNPSFLVAT